MGVVPLAVAPIIAVNVCLTSEKALKEEKMTAPLASLKILDFTTLLPGPYATMMLADLGADVVRVESPTRSDLVRMKPPFTGGVSAWHATLNRSKRSIALDLKQPGADDVVKRLVKRYDVVLEQFRPGVMERLGVGYDDLCAANPRLIYCAITAYGQDGPYRERAGHDINILALSGIASHSGRAEGGPPPLGVQIADVGGGSFGAIMGILAAVIHRQQTGEGQFVDASMFDGALAWNALAAADTLAAGQDPEREGGLLNGGTYYDYYETRDGRYLAVGSLEPKFWQGFCEAIGRPDLVERGQSRNREEQEALKSEIRKVLASRTLAAWMAIFDERDVCVEPVLSVSEALEHPQTRARGMVVDIPWEDGSPQPQVAHPLKYSRSQPVYRHAGVRPGAHTEEVLAEAGYDEAEIAALRERGVVSVEE